jgi:hypothetical protein
VTTPNRIACTLLDLTARTPLPLEISDGNLWALLACAGADVSVADVADCGEGAIDEIAGRLRGAGLVVTHAAGTWHLDEVRVERTLSWRTAVDARACMLAGLVEERRAAMREGAYDGTLETQIEEARLLLLQASSAGIGEVRA